MIFKRIEPPDNLKKMIECYWIVENDDPSPVKQKIIPDGFPEIIFHHGAPYKIRLYDFWQIQSLSLLAGQIRSHFFLENTGKAAITGIKFKPAALAQLYDLSMDDFTDKVADLSIIDSIDTELSKTVFALQADHEKLIPALNLYFEKKQNQFRENDRINKALDLIFSKNGMITIGEIIGTIGIGERQLERLFRKYVGLSPKFYCRIIRFNYIFQLMQEQSPRLIDLTYDAGFFDQSHFIRNFKAFTGEDPSRYLFDEKNLANFFLKK